MQSIMESLNDPHARHAIMVHLPIAASVIGVGLLVLLAVFRFKSIGLRLAVSGLYVAATIGALLANNSGEAAEENVEHSVPALSAVEESALEEHEEMGESAWLWLLAPTVVSIGMFVPKRGVRVWAGALTCGAALGAAGWVGWTGHLGGKLVYEHGLGVPARGSIGDDALRATDPMQHRENDDEEHN